MGGIEPPFFDWQPNVITTIRHPPIVPGGGIGPPTPRFSVVCSTPELPRHMILCGPSEIRPLFQRTLAVLASEPQLFTVEMAGIEPATSCMPCKRSSRVSYIPFAHQVPSAGIEPATYALGVRCSNPLSYKGSFPHLLIL